MKFLFLPAMASGIERMFRTSRVVGVRTNRRPHQIDVGEEDRGLVLWDGELTLRPWTHKKYEGTPLEYDHLLLSYYYFRNRALTLPKGYIFGDCGGWSIKRYGMNRPKGIYRGGKNILNYSGGARHTRTLDPVDVLRWQADVCTVGALIDIPPVGEKKKVIFEKALATTLDNTGRALSTYERLQRDGHPFRWWGVVHGWTLEDLTTWWNKVRDIYPFDKKGEGWAFSARGGGTSHNPVAIAHTLRFIQKQKIRRVHFFAAAGAGAGAALCALGPRAGVQFVTVDSKGPFDMALNRKVILENKDGLSYKDGFEEGENTNCRDYLLEKCKCHSCDELREEYSKYKALIMEGGFNEYWRYRFAMHNLIRYFTMFSNIEKAAEEDADELLRIVLGNRCSEALQTFDGRRAWAANTGRPRSLFEFV